MKAPFPPCRCRPSSLLPAGATLLALIGMAPAAPGQVTGDDVKSALDRGVRFLKRTQRAAGHWPERHYAGGETALVTLALLQAGQPPDSASMRAALEHVRSTENELVYVVALKIMALAQADPQQYKTEIADAAEWLVQAQSTAGLWSYTPQASRFDHSNSQYALLGLHAAAEAGVPISPNVWNRARGRVFSSQNSDGGWGYRNGVSSYGSMTAANVANLNILGSSVAIPQEHTFRNGAAPHCGTYRGGRQLVNGLTWLARNFRTDANPRRENAYLYYWLYAVERAGILSGFQSFGPHDWYREGAAFLVRDQNADGSWGTRRVGSRHYPLVDTAFGVLFLAKGRKPLLAQKLQWSGSQSWNLDRHDLKHLVTFIGDKLGEPTAWQIVAFDAPLADWLAAPLLYVQGHTFPEWNDEQRAKLREYVEKGGTVLFEACCGRDAFRQGFAAFARETFAEQPLRTLDAGHPIYSAYFDVPPREIKGIDVGCRTSVLYSPHDLSCLWEQQDVRDLSEAAFKLGTNIAAFATGRQALRDRLDVVTLPDAGPGGAGLPSNDALRLAQVFYEGDWRPDAHALEHFAEFLRDQTALDVVTAYAPVRLDDERLAVQPILYLTGHYAFELSPSERAGLAAHLRRGGFLLADACCGREAFDASFRKLVADAFPEQRLEKLPLTHAILRGQPGFALRTVGYKPAALEAEPDLDRPELWGLKLDGRLALVYSPYALGCGLDGHTCYNCRGLLDEDARKLAANIVLWALTH